MWTLVAAYTMCVVLLHVPTVQHFVGSEVAKALSEKLGTDVTVGRVDLGLFNRIVIDDVLIKDQQHKDMLLSHRLSAKVSVLDLLNNKITISSAQIFSLTANIIKPSADAPLNCQFVIDSLQSKDTTQHTPLDLHIGSLVIRNTNVNYDRLDMPVNHNTFDVNHLNFTKLSAHILLNALTDDSLSVIMNKLSVEEKNSGLNIQRLTFEGIADKKHIKLSDFTLKTAESNISLNATADINDNKITSYKAIVTNSNISTNDVALFVPQLSKINKTVHLTTTVNGTPESINIGHISLATNDKSLVVYGRGAVSSFRDKTWNADISTLHVDSHLANDVLTVFNQKGAQDIISKLGYVDAKLNASGSGNNYKGTADLKTAVGSIKGNGSLTDKHLVAKVTTSTIPLGSLLNTKAVGDVEAALNIKTDIVGGTDMLANTKAELKAPLLTLGKNAFRNVQLNVNQSGKSAKASLLMADLYVNAAVDMTTSNLPALISAVTKQGNRGAAPVTLNADIAHIIPYALGLTAKDPTRSYSASLNVDVRDIRNPLNNIIASIDNLHMSDPDGNYYLDHLTAESKSIGGGERSITLDSDFANATVEGAFDINTLQQSITNLIASRLPTLPGLPNAKANNNHFTVNVNVQNTEALQKIMDVEMSISDPITLNGFLDSRSGQTDLQLKAPSLTYNGTTYAGTNIHVFSPGDVLHVIANTSRQDDNGTPLKLQLEGQAADNELKSVISWVDGTDFYGNINTTSHFMTNAAGQTEAIMNIQPSEIMIRDTAWQVKPSTVTYYANHLDVDSFSVERGSQHIRIDGTATPSSDDSLIVSLKDVNVRYILDLVNFHSVDFDGLASGTATASSVFSTPEARANLIVRDFLFESGRMGTLYAKAKWNNELGQIDIDGLCDDTPGKTKIDGYVSIKRNYIDLDIKANRSRLEFLQSFCSSFLENVQAEGTGSVRVFGDLSTVNLTGNMVAKGTMHVSSLNTDYTMKNDTVTMIPDEIIFKGDSIFDKQGGYGLLSGALHHKHLTRMTFDFDIDAQHMLCYDFPNLDGGTFCGHCVASGDCKIKGRPGEITFDIEAYPEKTSEVVYNVSSTDALQDQEFITWRNTNDVYTANIVPVKAETKADDDEEEDETFRSNIRLNFLAHCTPESTLRLIMDQRTGDFITLNGSGTLRATWYNKGGMQIFGNYNVDHGTYKMTMQQVITKNFDFQSGGSIVFGGDPFESTLNLQALYVVPSVSLSDLNLASSLSTNTVRVNCLMNITGTAEHPVVDFDLSVPQASTDIQQMIKTLMDSEEERNQQVLYLLSIGRFYSADNVTKSEQSANQTTLAMQSFVSGTVSQQLNNIISEQLLKSHNWNFGANISPGDEGMDNAEYEGIVNGSLFNNRLLINGQFGYRDNINTTSSSFIGDFDVRYLITRSGNIQLRVYNQTTDRYFIKNNLNTQGVGIVLKHDFDNILPKFLRRKK